MRNLVKKIPIVSLFIGLLGFGGTAFANSFSCKGTVEVFGIHSTNSVFLRLSSMSVLVKVCDLEAEAGTSYRVTPEQCKVIYSTLLTAYAMGEVLDINFDNVGEAANCSSFTAWQLATARNVFLDRSLNN